MSQFQPLCISPEAAVNLLNQMKRNDGENIDFQSSLQHRESITIEERFRVLNEYFISIQCLHGKKTSRYLAFVPNLKKHI